MSEATEKSLYARLGGYDAIAAVTDDLLGCVQGARRRRDRGDLLEADGLLTTKAERLKEDTR
jgi:hypothetical protein